MITIGSRVEHTDTGQQGTITGRAHSRGKEQRWYVKWSNGEFETPLGVVESLLIELRSPRVQTPTDERRNGTR